MATIDLARVIDRLETYFARHDLKGAERHLLFWREEAQTLGDDVGVKQVDNELIGLYRRTNEKDKALAVAERLLPTLAEDNVGDATIKLNVATDYCHFGLPEQAQPLYREVERIYRQHLPADDYRLASLFNNMAAYANAVKDYAEAERLYRKALDVMEKIVPIMPETAVSYVNLAVSKYMQNPLDGAVDEAMSAAYDVLMTPSIPHDGNYAFVLSKVIPVYRHLGYQTQMAALQQLMRSIESNT
jgi:tetratricopeptide (TPR) repeat protein